MTALRRRMLADLRMRNYSPRTEKVYVSHVAQFARHHGRSPEELGHEEVRGYLRHLIEDRKVSRARSIRRSARCASFTG